LNLGEERLMKESMQDNDQLEQLIAKGRLPAAVVSSECPALPAPAGGIDLRDRFQGCLLGVAIGDALGRPGEGRPHSATVERYGGPLREFKPWRGWTSGPVGTITDDTQMTMCIAESIVATGRIDFEEMGLRFASWLSYGRGKGRTCVEACSRLRDGIPWYEAGVKSAGNGAAMRTAPLGLLRYRDLRSLRVDSAIVAMITHADPTAIASAIAQSSCIAFCLTQTADSVDVRGLIDFVVEMIDGIEPHDIEERRPGGGQTTLAKRLSELPDLLRNPDSREVYNYLYNGAFVLESLPTAFYAFLQNHESFDEAMFAAVDAGYDCDTSGSLAAALAGALHGRSGIPTHWLEGLEHCKELIELADEIFRLSAESECEIR